MASIAIMLGGAVLNASTFIGGSYLAKYLSGSKTDQERRRHDKALEKYQKDYAKYQENRQKLLDWQEQNRHEDAKASRNFENTDEALKLYNKFHPDENMQINEPVFSDYYRPSKDQMIRRDGICEWWDDGFGLCGKQMALNSTKIRDFR